MGSEPLTSDHLLDRHRTALPSVLEMMEWIADVVGFGLRRPGTDAGHRVEDWCVEWFKRFGLQDVRKEAFDVPVWEPGQAQLEAWPAGRPGEAVTFTGFALPHTQPTDGVEADLVSLDPGDGANDAAAGAIAVDTIELGKLPSEFMRTVATGSVDPEGALDGYEHLLPFSLRLGREVDTAIAASAAGYVGVLSSMPWDTSDYYLPYDAVERDLPGLWLDRQDGARLAAMQKQGPVRGCITVEGRRRPGHSSNVLGVLPGRSDQWVIIGSHHDAPWASAVEDGSGIALVLGQARFWAQVAAGDRPHNLLFLLSGGHMAGAAGLEHFREHHRDLLSDVVLAVHLEHAAAGCQGNGNGELVATVEPEVRWWFTSRDPALEGAVASALTAEELGKSWVLPPEAFGEFPPTDGGMLHLDGVPIVDFLSAPVYLVDACDTLDKVHQPSLEPLSRATVRIIESVAGRNAAEARKAIQPS